MPHPLPARRTPRLTGLRSCRIPVVLILTAAPLAALGGCSEDSSEKPVHRSSLADPRGDVVVSGLDNLAQTVVAAPRNTITDIVTTTVEHGPGAITVDVRFADLRPRQYLDVTAYLTTDTTGSDLPAQVTALTYQGESSIDVYEADGASRCTAATVSTDDEANAVIMSVPRDCVGEPRWVQARVVAATMRYDGATTSRRAHAVWEDDAYRDGQKQRGAAAASPRLYRP